MDLGNNNSNKVKVSVVIPVYNSEGTIARLGEELIKALGKSYRPEIILVNDFSRDNSESVCAAFQQKYPEYVRFYSLAKNVGEHNTVMAGLNQTTGEFVIIMDDDFQNPIEEAVKLLDYAVEHDFDVTYSQYKKKRHSIFRNLFSRFNDKIANIMLKKPRDLYLSSFKVLNRFLVNEIIQYSLPYPYIDGLILRTTSRIGKMYVEHYRRTKGRSGYTPVKLIRLWLNMFTNFSILPLRISFCLGFVFSLLGLIFGIATIIEKLSKPDIPMGYTSLILIVLLFAGIQLISLGVVGEYLGRVFMVLNKKPQYSIRKSWESDSNLPPQEGRKESGPSKI